MRLAGRRGAPAGSSAPKTARTITALSLCGIVVSLQNTLPLPLVNDLPRLLNTTPDNASWVLTSTVLAGTVAIPVISRLADMYGKRRLILITLFTTVVGSLLGSFGDSLPIIIVARSLQGVGLALVPVGIALMRDELPRHRVPLGVALMSSTIAVGAAAALPIAGLLVGHCDWHAIFHITAVVGAVLFLLVLFLVRESPIRPGGRFDFLGATLLTTALTAIMLALTKSAAWGWFSLATVGLTVSGLVLLAVWCRLQLRSSAPLINIRTATLPTVLLVNIATLLLGYAMFLNMLMTSHVLHMPQTADLGFGMDAMSTGLWMAPVALVFGATAPPAAAISRRLGPAVTLVIGSMVMATAYVIRSIFYDQLWQVLAGSMLVAIGTCLACAAMPVLIMRSVPVTETSAATGLNTLMRYLGTAISSAATAAVLSTESAPGVAQSLSVGTAAGIYWSAALASAVACLVAAPTLFERLRGSRSVELIAPTSVA